jgi:hypothetical protein
VFSSFFRIHVPHEAEKSPGKNSGKGTGLFPSVPREIAFRAKSGRCGLHKDAGLFPSALRDLARFIFPVRNRPAKTPAVLEGSALPAVPGAVF